MARDGGLRLGRRELAALAVLWLVAAGQRAWNAYAVTPLRGYDAPGHAGYMLTILEEGRLPHPTEGWSTFHPPLYYVIGSGVWAALDPLGPRAVVAGLRSIGALAGLAAALVAYLLVRRLGGPAVVAWVATALVLFVPCNQMAAAMEGNEAFAAALGALALPALLALQAEPRNLRAAGTAGLVAGLALVAKFNSVCLAGACLAPFAGRRLDRRALVSLALLLAAMALVAAPVYVRNVVLTGSPLPMTRDFEPMRSVEAAQVLRPRRALDYVTVSADCLRRPSVFHVAGAPAGWRNRNPAMTSVWGLTYASIWWDAFAHRVPWSQLQDGAHTGPALALLGLVPTATMLLGFVAAAAGCVVGRGRPAETPLVVLWLLGLGMFVAFTWTAPSTAAVKGAYLLPLAVPGAVFFARGVALLGRRLRAAVLLVSAAAALTAAVVFTEGVVFWAEPLNAPWRTWSAQLPHAHIEDAMARLLGPR